MTTGATGQLGLALPVQGELSGTWGDTVNNGITQYTNIAIAATLTLTNDGAVTLANTTGDASATNITSSLTGAGTVTAQFAIVKVTGTLTTAKVITAPSYSKTYVVVNAATGGIVTFKASGQTGVSIAVGESAWVYYNGTDYVKIAGTTSGAAGGSNTQVQYNSSGSLAGSSNLTFDGTNLTLGGGTANGVTYLNGSKVLTSGSALTFDGTNLGVGGAAGNSTNYSTITARGTNGGIYEFNAGATLQSYILGNSSELRLQTQSTQAITFVPNGSEIGRFTSTGLGIGTSSPATRLDIVKASTGDVATFTGTGGAKGYLNVGGTTVSIYDSSAGAGNGIIFGSSGTSAVRLQYGGTVGVTLDSAGNLGLGVTPSAWQTGANLKALQVGVGGAFFSDTNSAYLGQNVYQNSVGTSLYINTNYASKYQQSSSVHSWHIAPSGTAGNAISFTQAMTLDASGNLGVGTTSPTVKLDVSSTGSNVATLNSTAANGAYLAFAASGTAKYWIGSAAALTSGSVNDLCLRYDANMIFSYQGVERNRMSASGGLSIGTTADPGTGGIYATGNITAYYSDDRLKTRLGNIENALDKVDQLQGFYYEANETAQALGYKPKREVGVSAQSVQAVLPEIVSPAPIDQQYLTVDYERLVPLLIEAVKELTAKVKALEAK